MTGFQQLLPLGVLLLCILTLCLSMHASTADFTPGASESTDASLARADRIRERFQDAVDPMHGALASEIEQLIRVDFELSPQLLLPGEEVTLRIRARSSAPPNAALDVWEHCYALAPTVHRFDLDWRKEREEGSFVATWSWRPPSCGNYLVRWQCDIGGDVPEFWRNVAVVERGWPVMILNSTSHRAPRPEPELHRLHLPFSYWAESLLFGPRAAAEQFVAFSRGARQFGDDPGLLVFLGGDYLPDDKTVFYDEPEPVQRAVLACYRELWALCGFPNPLDSLYTYGIGNGPAEVARASGINLLGALCADQNWGDGPFKINHWGMPARPYFVSEEDFRKPGPGGKGATVGVQQCERQTVLCRDYGCVYAFESGIAYAFDQYSGITRPRTVNDMILSREMDFLECFLNAADQAGQPYLFSCGIEMNGVWPEMADINRHFMELLVRQARSTPLAFTTASDAAAFMRRHYDRIPETVLYLPDVFAGREHGGKPPLYPDTLEIENASFRAIFRRGETLPYAQYDYTVPWDYPDWGNEDIPRKPDGYVVPETADRFRVTPSIVDTRPFRTSTHTAEREAATCVTMEIDAEEARQDLALAVWDIARTFSRNGEHYRLTGAKRFIPVRAPFTENLCGIVVADMAKGRNRIELVVTSRPRNAMTIDFQLGESVKAKVFERGGSATAYVFAEGTRPAEVRCVPPEGVPVEHYPFDSDEPRALDGATTLRVEPGKCQRLSTASREQIMQALPGAQPLATWDAGQALKKRDAPS